MEAAVNVFEQKQYNYEAKNLAKIEDLAANISCLSSLLRMGPPQVQPPEQPLPSLLPQQQSLTVSQNQYQHSNTKKLYCDICNVTFNTDKSFKSHVRSTHRN